MKKFFAILVLAALFCFAGCKSSPVEYVKDTIDNETVVTDIAYTKYNIHCYTRGANLLASSANYYASNDHYVLPCNTKVKVSFYSRIGIKLTALDGSGTVVNYECNPNHTGGLDRKNYIPVITSPIPVEYPKLSDIDKKGIKQAQGIVGMSKDGVKVAMGYPAKSGTYSLDNDTWYYWKNKFVKTAFRFEDNKLVSMGK